MSVENNNTRKQVMQTFEQYKLTLEKFSHATLCGDVIVCYGWNGSVIGLYHCNTGTAEE